MIEILPDEITKALTGKTRPSAQRRALDRMGIPYIVRADGSVVVFEENVPGRGGNGRDAAEPDFDAIRRKA
jgi:hypothetical protein